jgi:hypothetical protein
MSSTDWTPPLNVKITPQFAALIPLLMAAEGDHSFHVLRDREYLDASLLCKVEMLALCFSDSGDGVTYFIWEGGLDVSTEPKPLNSFDDAMADYQQAIEWGEKDPEAPCPDLVWDYYEQNDGG